MGRPWGLEAWRRASATLCVHGSMHTWYSTRMAQEGRKCDR